MSNVTDQLQLIDPDLIREIAALDAAGLRAFATERLDELNKVESPEFFLTYGFRSGGMKHFNKLFDERIDDDPDAMIQGLINDLAFIGKPVRLKMWFASGYLDHGSSA